MKIHETQHATSNIKTGVALRDEPTDHAIQACEDTATTYLLWP